MKNVILIGCGNIGLRHLQAITSMHSITDTRIVVVEPNADLHAGIRAHMETVTPGAFILSNKIPSQSDTFDLAVIATSSNIRRSVLDALLAIHQVTHVILEKIAFCTVADLDEVQEIFAAKGIAAFVNCSRRTFPGYQALQETLSGSDPVHLFVSGTQWALASNAIHFTDITGYLNQELPKSIDITGLEAGYVPSKRPEFVEVFGTLSMGFCNGATATLTCEQGDAFDLQISLRCGDREVVVDERTQAVILTGADGKNKTSFETRYVSQTPEVYESLLTGHPCPLTPYDEAVAHHRLLISALNAHIGLPEGRSTVCPIS